MLDGGAGREGVGDGWTRHASGTVLAESEAVGRDGWAALRGLGSTWPPAGAEQLDVEFLYDRLAEAGYSYGPVFQGVRAAWRWGGEIYAEVALAEDAVEEAARFGVHPALLDAALHPGLLEWGEELCAEGQAVPFSLEGVDLRREGLSSLRVRLGRGEGRTLRVVAFDEAGEPVLRIGSLRVRPVEAGQLSDAQRRGCESLHRLEWVEVPVPELGDGKVQRVALPGEVELGGSEGDDAGEWCSPSEVARAGDVERHEDLGALVAAAEGGASVPDVVFLAAPRVDAGGLAGSAVRALTREMLEVLQAWLARPELADAVLVVLTSGAIAVEEGQAPDLAAASLWGLLRTAQSEHPGRFVIVDGDPAVGWDRVAGDGWLGMLAAGEPQLAVRGGRVLAPRLVGLEGGSALVAPVGEGRWHLSAGGGGTLEDLGLVRSAGAWEPLGVGQVRVAVRAAGLNFRDVLVALGMYPGEGSIGGEGAGVVLEVGEGVSDLAVGDRVMGLMEGAFGPVAVAEREMVVRVPEGWSFVQAAAVPAVFLTAYYALVDLAGLQRGESLLVHAAAGGVGMAAVQIARHLGAEVFATASPAKAGVLAGLGVAPERVGSSRNLEFEQRFLRASRGRGVDVVLNSLAREFTDASLRLLGGGGRFIEMGKTDIRDAELLAQEHAGVGYRAFELAEAGPARIQEMLRELLELFEQGVLTPSPVTTWDVRRGVEAFRFMREGRHVGKLVLTIPQPPDPQGTVLITGGTGVLGGLLARRLAGVHGARHLLLASRSGLDAEGARDLVAELAELGCEARVVACDVADRAQAEALIASIPPERPLTAVIHTAGVLDDGTIESLSTEQVERVMRPKVDAALHLHELTADLELAEFVVFSSVAGLLGSAGQGNYAAANAFLDALAQARRAQGLAGQSLAWGFWEQISGLSSRLGESGRARLARQGILPFSDGPELFDAARNAYDALLAPVRFDAAGLRAQASSGMLPAILRQLVRHSARRAQAAPSSLARQLASMSQADRETTVQGLVRAQAASVLGHDSPQAIGAQRAFKELGLDSLGAVELRNRLARATGLRLPSTLVFDYPNAAAIAGYLVGKIVPGPDGGRDTDAVELEIRRVLASIPLVRLRESGLYEQLVKLASPQDTASTEEEYAAIDEMDAETLVRMTLGAEAAEEAGGRT